ncbi:unnamed protein product [Adineta steineri]|uniref:Uncharacterized protein n=1 Tax=Adineta steineri TaxID=433720 RepID=A0A818M543_9BILA|nr:unnamed protein product [Adineta steineri]CAF3554599.1 unnamed protein product [Adineta steineri]CAF3586948.1 unnamed protein product [Adineta steineri]
MEDDIKSFYEQFSIENIDNQLEKSSGNNNNFDDSNNQSKQSLQYENLSLLENPKYIGFFYDGQNECTMIYQIGFKDSEPVYRVSHRCGSHGEGTKVGDLIIHRPALFPIVLLECCGPNQVDVTIRRKI